jgi:predicted signal transduction protein with EAL and GGDEF domain
MSDLRLYRVLSAVPLPYRIKVVGLAALAAALPLAALGAAIGAVHPTTILLALAAIAITLAALAGLLRPIVVVADRLEGFAGDAAAPGDGVGDEVERIFRYVHRLGAELETLRRRATARHPISGLQPRDPFLSSLDLRNPRQGSLAVLGVVRFVDYDRLAAFDQAYADRFLAAFAERLTATIHKSRRVGQVDRDCFAIFFDAIPDAAAATAELQSLAYVLRQELASREGRLLPEVTVGAAVFPQDASDAPSLLTRAFAALPAPGPTAGAKVVLFSSEIAQAAKERFGLEQNLRHAIGRDELLLHFQPVVDLAATKVVGAEALLRWRHPERGLVPPAEFIPIIEESGMMEEFGMWVLNAACREARLWELAGLTGLKMAVNVSARQLRQDRLVRMLIHTLDRYGLDPAALELELTESAALVDDVETRDLLAELRAMGISLAIDDFGAGYSSLSNLRKLPFNKLKIDREFVAGVDADRDNHAICGALVELARGLEITVLAEGAETLQEVESLQGLGCSMFQGYFFSRPLPAADFARTVVDPEWLALLASPVHRHIATLNRRVAR